MSAISGPGEPIRAPIKMGSPANKAEVQALLKERGLQMNVKFFDREYGKVQKNSDTLKSGAKWSFGLAGVAGAIATGVVIAVVKGTLAAGAIAAMATPVGWAAVGLLALGGTLLLCRHLMLKYHELGTDTGKQSLQALGWGVAGYVIVVAIWLAFQDEGDFAGGVATGMVANEVMYGSPLPLPSLSEVPETPLKKTNTKNFLLFKEDVVVVEKNSQGKEVIQVRNKDMQQKLHKLKTDAQGTNNRAETAALNLARKYDQGDSELGITQNDEAALHYYTLAAVAQNAHASYIVAERYYEGNKGVAAPDIKRAASFFQQAALAGHPKGQVVYGRMLLKGEIERTGLKQDELLAFTMFTNAAAKGSAAANLELGKMYANGLAGTQDLAMAKKHFREAIRNSFSEPKAAAAAAEALQKLNEQP